MINRIRPVARRLSDLVLRAALTLPLLLCAALLLGWTSARAGAEETGGLPACRDGVSALPRLEASPEWAAIEAEAAASPNGEGRLFRIGRPGLPPSHLFGTFHMSDARILARPPAVAAAFDASERLVIETTDILDEMRAAAALLMRPDLMSLPDGGTIADLLAPDEMRRLEAELDRRSIPLAAVRSLQPWFLTVSLSAPPCEAAREAAGLEILDVRLAEDARSAGKAVDGLESAAEQIEAMASLSPELQADGLVASLDLADRMPDIFETMIDLYLEGRIATISPAIERLAPAGTTDASSLAIYQAFEERIIDERNRTMAERLQPILGEGGAFVAVGALHLPGEQGLVELLRRDGWQVTRAD